MKMLCDYCDKRNECTKIISNKLCLEFAHKLSFIEISDSKEIYALDSRMKWHSTENKIDNIFSPCHYIINGSSAFAVEMYDDLGNRHIFGEFEIEDIIWFFNKDEAEAVANILNSCRG